MQASIAATRANMAAMKSAMAILTTCTRRMAPTKSNVTSTPTSTTVPALKPDRQPDEPAATGEERQQGRKLLPSAAHLDQDQPGAVHDPGEPLLLAVVSVR